MAARHPLMALSLACLSACVAQTAPETPRAVALADGPVTVGDRLFQARFVPGASGITLTNAGAVPVAGTGVQVSGADLGRDEGIVAKEAARRACEDAGGRFQPQALGRYAAQGIWAFDGACA
jgi:hypothetical protein